MFTGISTSFNFICSRGYNSSPYFESWHQQSHLIASNWMDFKNHSPISILPCSLLIRSAVINWNPINILDLCIFYKTLNWNKINYGHQLLNTGTGLFEKKCIQHQFGPGSVASPAQNCGGPNHFSLLVSSKSYNINTWVSPIYKNLLNGFSLISGGVWT